MSLGRHRNIREGNVNIGIRDKICKDVDLIQPVLSHVRLYAFMKTELKVCSMKDGNFLPVCATKLN